MLLIALVFAVLDGINCQIAGGLSAVNASEYTGAAWNSVPEINSKNNGQNDMAPIKVVTAQVQVLAGTNTVLEVLVGESTCPRQGSVQASQVTAANCPLKSGGKRELYKVSIWEK
ncbi:hypothetical protein EI013_28265, partial [Escherichia coli]|nr:hypothetical protein [Escherichia coli]